MIQNGELFFIQMTWLNNYVIKYDKDLKEVERWEFPKEIKEGWGITHDPSQNDIYLISNGSEYLFEVDFSKKPLMIVGKRRVGLADSEQAGGGRAKSE